MKWLIATIVGCLCSTIVFLFGEIDSNLKYLIAVVILDYITGLCRAIIKKKVNSSIGIKGIFKKNWLLCNRFLSRHTRKHLRSRTCY